MKDELISFKTAKLAKNKGCDLLLYKKNQFEYTDEEGNEYFTNKEGGICGTKNTKPVVKCTQSLLQRWLREVHKIDFYVKHDKIWNTYYHIGTVDRSATHKTDLGFSGESMKNTYEEAHEIGLLEALKLIKV